MPSVRPKVSVVVEGYNQSRQLGVADDTIAALLAQDYPLGKVELVLVGSTEQTEYWDKDLAGDLPFHSVKTVACDGAHYYELKNRGASSASGEIVAFTDSDVRPRPTWISAIVENIDVNGADVTLGPSMFGREGAHDPDSLFMRMCSAVTWGWVFGPKLANGRPRARGFMDHNVAMRREVAQQFQYKTQFGRIVASPLLFRALADAGKIVAIHPGQQAVHAFWVRYWLIGLQFRYGYEVYRLRRLDQKYPTRWIGKTGPLEPLFTMGWHLMLDVPKWFRVNQALGKSRAIAVLGLAPFVVIAFGARFCEMLGMYSTLLAPERTRAWAEQV